MGSSHHSVLLFCLPTVAGPLADATATSPVNMQISKSHATKDAPSLEPRGMRCRDLHHAIACETNTDAHGLQMLLLDYNANASNLA